MKVRGLGLEHLGVGVGVDGRGWFECGHLCLMPTHVGLDLLSH